MPDARDLCNKAVELAESGQYDETLGLMNKAINLDANNTNAWYNNGIILFKMCRYRDALNSFSQVTDIDPEFVDAWYKKGIALMERGNAVISRSQRMRSHHGARSHAIWPVWRYGPA